MGDPASKKKKARAQSVTCLINVAPTNDLLGPGPPRDTKSALENTQEPPKPGQYSNSEDRKKGPRGVGSHQVPRHSCLQMPQTVPLCVQSCLAANAKQGAQEDGFLLETFHFSDIFISNLVLAKVWMSLASGQF